MHAASSSTTERVYTTEEMPLTERVYTTEEMPSTGRHSMTTTDLGNKVATEAFEGADD